MVIRMLPGFGATNLSFERVSGRSDSSQFELRIRFPHQDSFLPHGKSYSDELRRIRSDLTGATSDQSKWVAKHARKREFLARKKVFDQALAQSKIEYVKSIVHFLNSPFTLGEIAFEHGLFSYEFMTPAIHILSNWLKDFVGNAMDAGAHEIVLRFDCSKACRPWSEVVQHTDKVTMFDNGKGLPQLKGDIVVLTGDRENDAEQVNRMKIDKSGKTGGQRKGLKSTAKDVAVHGGSVSLSDRTDAPNGAVLEIAYSPEQEAISREEFAIARQQSSRTPEPTLSLSVPAAASEVGSSPRTRARSSSLGSPLTTPVSSPIRFRPRSTSLNAGLGSEQAQDCGVSLVAFSQAAEDDAMPTLNLNPLRFD